VAIAAVVAVALAVHLFVVFYEEPTLRKKFGAEYEELLPERAPLLAASATLGQAAMTHRQPAHSSPMGMFTQNEPLRWRTPNLTASETSSSAARAAEATTPAAPALTQSDPRAREYPKMSTSSGPGCGLCDAIH
jgi:hypothetical protein